MSSKPFLSTSVEKVWDLVRLGRPRTFQAREEVTGRLVGVAHFPILNLETLVLHRERARCGAGAGSGLLEETKRVAKEDGLEVCRN